MSLLCYVMSPFVIVVKSFMPFMSIFKALHDFTVFKPALKALKIFHSTQPISEVV